MGAYQEIFNRSDGGACSGSLPTTTRKRAILLCTVGTSLFRPNLEGLKHKRQQGPLEQPLNELAMAYERQDWPAVASALLKLQPVNHLCGAEINSIASMLDNGYAAAKCGLFFFHSDTPDGRAIASVLKSYYKSAGHESVEIIAVPGLQDEDAQKFRTTGLRNLAKQICAVVRQYSAPVCAINATGGYKAQIAIAVLMGQAIGIPVYYKHERFSDIIGFPPMPVAIDLPEWMHASGVFHVLEREGCAKKQVLNEEWKEEFDQLVEYRDINGECYVELSPSGLIFHETFRERFCNQKESLLPPPAQPNHKQAPFLHDFPLAERSRDVLRLLEQLTAAVPHVVRCTTVSFDSTTAEYTRFRINAGQIEGILATERNTVKFRVETTAQTSLQQAAVLVLLNEFIPRWIGESS